MSGSTGSAPSGRGRLPTNPAPLTPADLGVPLPTAASIVGTPVALPMPQSATSAALTPSVAALTPAASGTPAAPPLTVASTRKVERDRQDYDEIFKYMQNQLAYIKRKIVKIDMATQCDLQLPLCDLDEVALSDVSRLLAEAQLADDNNKELNLNNCLIRSDKLNAVLSKVSEQAARMLAYSAVESRKQQEADSRNNSMRVDNPGMWNERDVLAQRERMNQQAEVVKKLEHEHQIALRQQENKLKSMHEARMEEIINDLKSDHATKTKKLEQMWSIKLEEVEAESQRVAAVLKAEVAALKNKLSEAVRSAEDLKEQKKELIQVIEVKDALALNFKRDHYSAQIMDHERNATAMSRTAQATASLVNLLRQKQNDVEQLQNSDSMYRLRTTFQKRERVMQQTLEDCFAKIDALQDEYNNLLEIHNTTCESLSKCVEKSIQIGKNDYKMFADGGGGRGGGRSLSPKNSPKHKRQPQGRAVTSRMAHSVIADRLLRSSHTDGVEVVDSCMGSIAVLGGTAARQPDIDFTPSVTTISYKPHTPHAKKTSARSPALSRSI